MEPRCVVEILQNGKSRGSGYIITPRHVLTARHVAKPSDVGTKCMVHPLRGIVGQPTVPADEQRPQAISAKVGWVSDLHDLALIEIIGEPFALSRTVAFGSIPHDGHHRQIVGSGFPEAAGADDRTIVGTLIWVETSPSRFDVDTISSIPRHWTKWRGFSGTAIFADNLLVGVVRSVKKDWGGGVLEATPAAWMLDDPSFRAYLEESSFSLPTKIDAGALDPSMPLDFEMNVPVEGTLRFSPRNPSVPFLGRDQELAALDEFLTADRERPFVWWLVTGSGGTGKTRLARELCLRARRQGWRAGFMPSGFEVDVSAIDAWCPRTPTLIVADYVTKRVNEIRKLATRLGRRDGLPPLRLLLLEREAGRLFENQFVGSDLSDRSVIEGARYQKPPLAIPELTKEQVWALVERCPWRSDAASVPIDSVEFFERLRKMDRQRRPLVAMILADALAASGGHTNFTGLTNVLQDLLRRDRDHLWPYELSVANTPVGKAEADVAIAFATLVDGLGRPELDAIEAARGRPVNPAILPACSRAIGKPVGEAVRCLGPLEPDLIGEFFVLETLCGDLDNPFEEAPHAWLPETAWRTRGDAMFDFVARAKQTFPQHVSIPKLSITVRGVKESWLLAAFSILSQSNNLTDGFTKLQEWMPPHAQSDVSAALALADLTLAATAIEGDRVDSGVVFALIETLCELLTSHVEEPALRERAVMALVNKGITLGMLGRSEEAIAVYDDVATRFGEASEPVLRELVAKALVNKGGRLGMLGHGEEEIAVYDDVVTRFGEASEPALCELVAKALLARNAAQEP